jgi:signal transduction histidine kinase
MAPGLREQAMLSGVAASAAAEVPGTTMNAEREQNIRAARGETPSPGRSRLLWAWVRPLVQARTWVVTGYLLLLFVTATVWWTVLVTGFALGAGLLLVWVGLPILAALPILWRTGARLERVLAGRMLRVEIAPPYRAIPSGSLLSRARAVLADPATWKDLAYLLLLIPLGWLWSLVTLTVWANVFGLVFAPLYYYALPEDHLWWFGWYQWSPLLTEATLPTALLACVIGLILTVPAAWLVRGMAHLHGLLARALLGPSEKQTLTAQAAALRVSRDHAVDAATAERHRIERALHDGAQARLVSVAMQLGMAKGKLEVNPEAGRELVETAHVEAKQAIAELRDLARGIYPAVLADRGLDAALSDLARRCPVPVQVTIEPVGRLPVAVEETAYFVIAEALTNLAKHASATHASLSITRAGEALAVEVTDDGAGGAEPSPGSGLAGLSDRVAGLGGSLQVSSPAGGPTTLRAELPCAS